MFYIKTILGTMKKRVFSAEEKMQIIREAEVHGATSTYFIATSTPESHSLTWFL